MGSYQSGRRFLPYGWGTTSVKCCGPCMGRNDRKDPVTVKASPFYEPSLQKYAHPRGINTYPGRDWVKNDYDNDKCRGRGGWSPNQETQAPINVELKMCPVAEPTGANQGCSQQGSSCSNGFNPSDTFGSHCMKPPVPRRCPPGNKVERTKPFVPIANWKPNMDKGNARTTYQADYFAKELGSTVSYRPLRITKPLEGELVTDSTYRKDFPKHPIQRFTQKQWGHEKEYKMPTEAMNVFSSYRLDYQKKHGKAAESTKKKALIDANPPLLDDTTTYKVEFVPHCLPERVAKKTDTELKNEINSACAPFDGLSIYKRDYLKVMPCRHKAVKQVSSVFKSTGSLDDRTTYSVAFEPYYFEDVDCIPAHLYDSIYPRKDKCADVRCYREADRVLTDGLPTPQPYIPDTLYAPRTCEPCVSPYVLESTKDLNDNTTITVRHNTNGDVQAGEPTTIECPPISH